MSALDPVTLRRMAEKAVCDCRNQPGCSGACEIYIQSAHVIALLDRLDAAERDHDAGREWMRCAWKEFNAIRARRGAPPGIAHEWWSELTDGLGALLGNDTVPWMTGAAKQLVAPFRERAEAAEARAEKAERERDKALGSEDAHWAALQLADARAEKTERERDDARAIYHQTSRRLGEENTRAERLAAALRAWESAIDHPTWRAATDEQAIAERATRAALVAERKGDAA